MVKGGEGGGSIVLCLIMVVGARMLLYSHISFPFVLFYGSMVSYCVLRMTELFFSGMF